MAQKVYIAVGHGGSDPGAVANGVKEKDVNLSIANYCTEYLKARGVLVEQSRIKDVDPVGTVRKCNEYAPDVAVSIHNNAGGGDGAEVYHEISIADRVFDDDVTIEDDDEPAVGETPIVPDKGDAR